MVTKMRGLTSLMLGSFIFGSGFTLLGDIWLKNNKYYKLVTSNNTILYLWTFHNMFTRQPMY